MVLQLQRATDRSEQAQRPGIRGQGDGRDPRPPQHLLVAVSDAGMGLARRVVGPYALLWGPGGPECPSHPQQDVLPPRVEAPGCCVSPVVDSTVALPLRATYSNALRRDEGRQVP